MSETARALDAIRIAELEAARRVERARADAAASLAAAHRDSARVVADARARGRSEARRRLETAVADAEREAEVILASCDGRIEAVRRAAAPHLPAAVAEMVDLLLAPPLEEGK